MSARRLALGVLVVALAVAGALVWRRERVVRASLPPPPDTVATGVRPATLWFAAADGDSLLAEPRAMMEQPDLHARVAALVAALGEGPAHGGLPTLPPGTEALHVYLDDRGLLTLDLSRAFRLGFRGGARAEELALGSLVHTLAANLPEVKQVRVVCGGVPIVSLGGHFPLDQPLDPKDWP